MHRWLSWPEWTHMSAVREKKWSDSSDTTVTSEVGSRFRTSSAASIPATPFPMMTTRIVVAPTVRRGRGYPAASRGRSARVTMTRIVTHLGGTGSSKGMDEA